jgi:hypothetical protein
MAWTLIRSPPLNAAAAPGTCLTGCQVRRERASGQLRCFTCGHEYGGERPDRCPVRSSGIVIETAPGLAAVGWTT